jgi:dienelactone hydrolase
MKKILLIISASFTIALQAQFLVGHMSINFNDASRTGGYTIAASGGTVVTMPGTGRTIGAEVYYPSTVAGNNANVAAGAFPVVVFGHGFTMGFEAYDNIYNRLASLGYIVMLPRTEGGIFPTPVHLDFGKDEAYLAAQGLALNTANTPSNVVMFNGKVLQKSAIGGHSMGAGASFLGAASNNTLTCLFNFAAATTNNTPNSIAQASLVTVPTLMITGELDSVADSVVQNSHYNNLGSAKKFHTIIMGLTHCEVGNGANTACGIGQASCGNVTCNTVFFNKYMPYLEPFLRNQLYSDCAAGNAFMALINGTDVNRKARKIQGTIACSTVGITEQITVKSFNVFPNPTQDVINVAYTTVAGVKVSFELFDITGKLVYKTTEESSQANSLTKELNISKLDLGTYILMINQKDFKGAYKIIKN